MAESKAGLGDNLDNLSVKYVNLNKSDFEDNSKTAVEIRSVKHLTTDLGAVYAVPEKAKFRGSGDSSALSSIKNINPDIIQGNNGDGHSIIVSNKSYGSANQEFPTYIQPLVNVDRDEIREYALPEGTFANVTNANEIPLKGEIAERKMSVVTELKLATELRIYYFGPKRRNVTSYN